MATPYTAPQENTPDAQEPTELNDVAVVEPTPEPHPYAAYAQAMKTMPPPATMAAGNANALQEPVEEDINAQEAPVDPFIEDNSGGDGKKKGGIVVPEQNLGKDVLTSDEYKALIQDFDTKHKHYDAPPITEEEIQSIMKDYSNPREFIADMAERAGQGNNAVYANDYVKIFITNYREKKKAENGTGIYSPAGVNKSDALPPHVPKDYEIKQLENVREEKAAKEKVNAAELKAGRKPIYKTKDLRQPMIGVGNSDAVSKPAPGKNYPAGFIEDALNKDADKDKEKVHYVEHAGYNESVFSASDNMFNPKSKLTDVRQKMQKQPELATAFELPGGMQIGHDVNALTEVLNAPKTVGLTGFDTDVMESVGGSQNANELQAITYLRPTGANAKTRVSGPVFGSATLPTLYAARAMQNIMGNQLSNAAGDLSMLRAILHNDTKEKHPDWTEAQQAEQADGDLGKYADFISNTPKILEEERAKYLEIKNAVTESRLMPIDPQYLNSPALLEADAYQRNEGLLLGDLAKDTENFIEYPVQFAGNTFIGGLQSAGKIATGVYNLAKGLGEDPSVLANLDPGYVFMNGGFKAQSPAVANATLDILNGTVGVGMAVMAGMAPLSMMEFGLGAEAVANLADTDIGQKLHLDDVFNTVMHPVSTYNYLYQTGLMPKGTKMDVSSKDETTQKLIELTDGLANLAIFHFGGQAVNKTAGWMKERITPENAGNNALAKMANNVKNRVHNGVDAMNKINADLRSQGFSETYVKADGTIGTKQRPVGQKAKVAAAKAAHINAKLISSALDARGIMHNYTNAILPFAVQSTSTAIKGINVGNDLASYYGTDPKKSNLGTMLATHIKQGAYEDALFVVDAKIKELKDAGEAPAAIDPADNEALNAAAIKESARKKALASLESYKASLSKLRETSYKANGFIAQQIKLYAMDDKALLAALPPEVKAIADEYEKQALDHVEQKVAYMTPLGGRLIDYDGKPKTYTTNETIGDIGVREFPEDASTLDLLNRETKNSYSEKEKADTLTYLEYQLDKLTKPGPNRKLLPDPKMVAKLKAKIQEVENWVVDRATPDGGAPLNRTSLAFEKAKMEYSDAVRDHKAAVKTFDDAVENGDPKAMKRAKAALDVATERVERAAAKAAGELPSGSRPGTQTTESRYIRYQNKDGNLNNMLKTLRQMIYLPTSGKMNSEAYALWADGYNEYVTNMFRSIVTDKTFHRMSAHDQFEVLMAFQNDVLRQVAIARSEALPPSEKPGGTVQLPTRPTDPTGNAPTESRAPQEVGSLPITADENASAANDTPIAKAYMEAKQAHDDAVAAEEATDQTDPDALEKASAATEKAKKELDKAEAAYNAESAAPKLTTQGQTSNITLRVPLNEANTDIEKFSPDQKNELQRLQIKIDLAYKARKLTEKKREQNNSEENKAAYDEASDIIADLVTQYDDAFYRFKKELKARSQAAPAGYTAEDKQADIDALQAGITELEAKLKAKDLTPEERVALNKDLEEHRAELSETQARDVEAEPAAPSKAEMAAEGQPPAETPATGATLETQPTEKPAAEPAQTQEDTPEVAALRRDYEAKKAVHEKALAAGKPFAIKMAKSKMRKAEKALNEALDALLPKKEQRKAASLSQTNPQGFVQGLRDVKTKANEAEANREALRIAYVEAKAKHEKALAEGRPILIKVTGDKMRAAELAYKKAGGDPATAAKPSAMPQGATLEVGPIGPPEAPADVVEEPEVTEQTIAENVARQEALHAQEQKGGKGNIQGKGPYNAVDAGQGFKIASVTLDQLHLDEDNFQPRELNDVKVARIAKNFNIDQSEPIKVFLNPKDGKLYVLAGHHRYYAWKARIERGDITPDTKGPVQITTAKTIGEAKAIAEASNAGALQPMPHEEARVVKRLVQQYRAEGHTEEEVQAYQKLLINGGRDANGQLVPARVNYGRAETVGDILLLPEKADGTPLKIIEAQDGAIKSASDDAKPKKVVQGVDGKPLLVDDISKLNGQERMQWLIEASRFLGRAWEGQAWLRNSINPDNLDQVYDWMEARVSAGDTPNRKMPTFTALRNKIEQALEITKALHPLSFDESGKLKPRAKLEIMPEPKKGGETDRYEPIHKALGNIAETRKRYKEAYENRRLKLKEVESGVRKAERGAVSDMFTHAAKGEDIPLTVEQKAGLIDQINEEERNMREEMARLAVEQAELSRTYYDVQIQSLDMRANDMFSEGREEAMARLPEVAKLRKEANTLRAKAMELQKGINEGLGTQGNAATLQQRVRELEAEADKAAEEAKALLENPTPEQVQQIEKTRAEKALMFLDEQLKLSIKRAKGLKGTLNSGIPGLTPKDFEAMYQALLHVSIAAVKGGIKLAEAIRAGMEHIKIRQEYKALGAAAQDLTIMKLTGKVQREYRKLNPPVRFKADPKTPIGAKMQVLGDLVDNILNGTVKTPKTPEEQAAGYTGMRKVLEKTKARFATIVHQHYVDVQKLSLKLQTAKDKAKAAAELQKKIQEMAKSILDEVGPDLRATGTSLAMGLIKQGVSLRTEAQLLRWMHNVENNVEKAKKEQLVEDVKYRQAFIRRLLKNATIQDATLMAPLVEYEPNMNFETVHLENFMNLTNDLTRAGVPSLEVEKLTSLATNWAEEHDNAEKRATPKVWEPDEVDINNRIDNVLHALRGEKVLIEKGPKLDAQGQPVMQNGRPVIEKTYRIIDVPLNEAPAISSLRAHLKNLKNTIDEVIKQREKSATPMTEAEIDKYRQQFDELQGKVDQAEIKFKEEALYGALSIVNSLPPESTWNLSEPEKREVKAFKEATLALFDGDGKLIDKVSNEYENGLTVDQVNGQLKPKPAATGEEFERFGISRKDADALVYTWDEIDKALRNPQGGPDGLIKKGFGGPGEHVNDYEGVSPDALEYDNSDPDHPTDGTRGYDLLPRINKLLIKLHAMNAAPELVKGMRHLTVTGAKRPFSQLGIFKKGDAKVQDGMAKAGDVKNWAQRWGIKQTMAMLRNFEVPQYNPLGSVSSPEALRRKLAEMGAAHIDKLIGHVEGGKLQDTVYRYVYAPLAKAEAAYRNAYNKTFEKIHADGLGAIKGDNGREDRLRVGIIRHQLQLDAAVDKFVEDFTKKEKRPPTAGEMPPPMDFTRYATQESAVNMADKKIFRDDLLKAKQLHQELINQDYVKLDANGERILDSEGKEILDANAVLYGRQGVGSEPTLKPFNDKLTKAHEALKTYYNGEGKLMAKQAARQRNLPFDDLGPAYEPFIPLGKSVATAGGDALLTRTPIGIGDDLVSVRTNGAKQSGRTQERVNEFLPQDSKGDPYPVSFDVGRNVEQHASSLHQDLSFTPVVKAIYASLDGATQLFNTQDAEGIAPKQWIGEIKRNVGNRVNPAAHMEDNGRWQEFLRKLHKALRVATLASLRRPIAEFISNVVKAPLHLQKDMWVGMMSKLAGKYGGDYAKNTHTLLLDMGSNIPERTGRNTDLSFTESKTLAEKTPGFKQYAKAVVGFADGLVNPALWRSEFENQFTRATGEKFDMDTYLADGGKDGAYFKEHKEAMEKAARSAEKTTEQLLNAHSTVTGATIESSRSMFKKIFNPLTSFARNEAQNFYNNMQLAMDSRLSGEERTKAVASALQTVASNYVYLQAMYGLLQGLQIGVAKATGNQFAEEEAKANLRSQFVNKGGLAGVSSALMQTMLGANGMLASHFGEVALGILEKTYNGKVDEDTLALAKQMFAYAGVKHGTQSVSDGLNYLGLVGGVVGSAAKGVEDWKRKPDDHVLLATEFALSGLAAITGLGMGNDPNAVLKKQQSVVPETAIKKIEEWQHDYLEDPKHTENDPLYLIWVDMKKEYNQKRTDKNNAAREALNAYEAKKNGGTSTGGLRTGTLRTGTLRTGTMRSGTLRNAGGASTTEEDEEN
jgi:hypothetical protein